MIEAIKQSALGMGACGKVKRVDNFTKLTQLMFSPQGIEFCRKNNFPSLEVFRAEKESLKGLNVYIDAGQIELDGTEYVCLVGDTQARIKASGVKHVHTVVLMHGAKAAIDASDYAVVKVENISGNYLMNKDKTVVIL